MNPTCHLAVDLGATSGRTVLAFYASGRVTTQELTRFRYPMLPIAGHLYWNLPLIYQEILNALRECGRVLRNHPSGISELTSIGIDSWGCDVAWFNPDGSLASLPFCYRDPHTAGAADSFCAAMPRAEVYARTGIQFMDFNTLFQLYTIGRHSPHIISSAHRILFIPDALAYMLTGNAVTEYTVASTSQMLNPALGDFDPDLLSMVGVSRSRFGRMVHPGEQIGTLTPQVCQATGLSPVPVVAVAGHDTASAVIAVPSPDAHFAYLSCGTWSLLGIESPAPVITPASLEYNFTNEGGIDGTTRLLKNICGLWLLERCRAEFTDAPVDIAELSALWAQSSCQSIIDPDDPAFANPDCMTAAIADYCSRTSQQVPSSPSDYVRIIFRSLARRYNQVLRMLRELSPVEISRLHVIGGGSLNPHLMQLAADATGLPVVAGPAECTALGNILVQLRAVGRVGSLAEMRRIAVASTETITYTPHTTQPS